MLSVYIEIKFLPLCLCLICIMHLLKGGHAIFNLSDSEDHLRISNTISFFRTWYLKGSTATALATPQDRRQKRQAKDITWSKSPLLPVSDP